MERHASFSLLFYARAHRPLRNGESPIFLRITNARLRTEISLSRSINYKDWDSVRGCAKGKAKEAKALNAYIESIRAQILNIVLDFRERNITPNPEIIKRVYLGFEEEAAPGFVEMFEKHNEEIKLLVGIDYSHKTWLRYNTMCRHIKKFVKRKFKEDDISVSDLDYNFIKEFEVYLKTVVKISHNTTMRYIKGVKKISKLAVTQGILIHDPFANFHIRFKKVDRGFLTEDELEILMKKELKVNRLDEVRDCFIFACFTGLAYVDLKALTYRNVVKGTDGNKWIKIHRQKTDVYSTIPILDIAQKIIDKYEGHPFCLDNDTLLPIKSNQKMNAYLKEIGSLCKLKKDLSSHLARHTFATTVTLNNDVPIETVSKMLGHSSVEMTKVYARLLDKKVGQDMKHLNGKYSM